MATHTADIRWTLKDGDDVAKGRFSRGHEVRFDGGVTVPASASPHVVGKWAVEAAVAPAAARIRGPAIAAPAPVTVIAGAVTVWSQIFVAKPSIVTVPV